MPLKKSLLLLFILSLSHLAEASFYISGGPEFCHFIRDREGGTHQEGFIKGIRINFERIKRYRLYFGADYTYYCGVLKGETATGRTLCSDLTDTIYEARVGFTFQQDTANSPFFTPFAGWGYFHEINAFFPPSPIPCIFTDTFQYFAAGFLSGINFTPFISLGVNFKLKFMQDSKSHVTEDPFYDRVTLLIKDELIARLDLPFYFHPKNMLLNTGMEISPFFEYRHFGGREGYPFNYRDTKFYLYGMRLTLTFPF